MRKNKTLTVILVLVSVLFGSLLLSMGLRLGKSQSYDALSANAYIVGTLDANGEFAKDGSEFVTEDFITVDGLQINVKENAKLSYQIYFYDENKEFISSTNDFGVSYNGTIPENAEFFKIEINPTEDTDISEWDIINYSAQIEVKFYK